MAYVYTLNDLYVMFREADSMDEKCALLREWRDLNLPYDLKWDNLLRVWDIDLLNDALTNLGRKDSDNPNGFYLPW